MADSRIRGPAAALLGAIFLFGINSMFGQIYRNGYVETVVRLLTKDAAVLPGSQNPLLTRYIGISPLDKLLTVGTVLWTNVTDGSAPQLSLYALHFGGQLVPVFTVMLVESLRAGNAATTLRFPIVWGYLMQAMGYASIMPIFCSVHLFTSAAPNDQGMALASSIRPRSLAPLRLRAVVPAFGLGYLLPTVLMAYPFSSSTIHQWLGALWQGFPLYVVVLQYGFAKLVSSTPKPGSPDIKTEDRTKIEDQRALSRVYDFAFYSAAVAQLITFTVLVTIKVYPYMFPNAMVETLSFGDVFRPGPFYSWKAMPSMAAAMHSFFLYDQYTGSAAAMVWAVAVYAGSTTTRLWEEWPILGWDVLRWCLVAGPGGAVVRLLQRRDKEVLGEQALVLEKKAP